MNLATSVEGRAPRGAAERRAPPQAGTREGSRRVGIGVLAAVLLMARAAGAAPITVAASVESNDVAVGAPFVLSIAINGAQNVPVPQLDGLDGFRSDYLGPSTQVSFVNGVVSTSVTHRYRLIAERAGQFTLGPFAVAYQGQRFETAPITMRVAAGAKRDQVVAPGGAQNLRLVLTPSKAEVYAGERTDLTVTLYVGNVRIRDLQYPVLTGEGVTVGKFGQPEESSEVVGGRRYQVVRLRTTLTPLQSGTVDLQATMAMQVVTNRRGADPLFESFFPGEAKPVELRAEAVPLTVLALPEDGRPPDFSGAIGQFDFTLGATPTQLTAGDPITVRMEISGRGELGALSPPVLPVGDDFRRYDAQPAKSEEHGDRRVFEQVVIPKTAGIAALPAVRFSYFDPEARAYRRSTRGPVALTVAAAAPAQGHVLDAAAPPPAPAAQAAQPLGRDIVYIKDAPGALRPRAGALYQRGWFLALQAVPPLFFAAVWAYVRRRDRLASDPRLARFRQAGREARRALAALQARPVGDPQFYDALSAAVAAYLGAKLDLPPGGVERERVAGRLAANGCNGEIRDRAGTLFELIERARYAPSGDAAAERATALQLAEAIVDGLERTRGLDRRIAAGIAFVLVAAALHGVLTHCNVSGELVAIAQLCKSMGKEISVIATETRPYLQGSRLTAWELAEAGVSVSLVPDCAAAQVMDRGEVNAVVVGSDRCAQNGDVINKVGTYPLALMAKEYGIPFYALVQDPGGLARGEDVPIEERSAKELLVFQGEPLLADCGDKLAGRYPAFDVTPAALVTRLIGFDDLFTPERFRQRYLKGSAVASQNGKKTTEKYLLVYGLPRTDSYSFLAHALQAEQAQRILIPEMRPQLWGARVVARELLRRQIPATLISDNMMGTLFAQGQIQQLYLFYSELGVEGPKGICGSLLAARLARAHGVPIELQESEETNELPADADVSTFLGRKVIPPKVAVYPIEKEVLPWALLKEARDGKA